MNVKYNYNKIINLNTILMFTVQKTQVSYTRSDDYFERVPN